jgi:hypothetical protein
MLRKYTIVDISMLETPPNFNDFNDLDYINRDF